MTRAADHLIISLYHHPPQHGRPDTHAMRLSHMLATLHAAGAACEPAAPAVPACRPEPAAATAAVLAGTRRLFLTARAELLTSVMTRLPTTATGLVEAAAAQPPEPPGPLEATATEHADPTGARPPGRGGATLGSTVHRALEILDLRETTDQAVNQATTAASAELRVPHMAGEVRSRVQAALTAPIIQLAATRRHWKEVPIIAELSGRVVEGVIDLIVDTDDGLVIVDYKTDSARTAADITAKAHHYTPQIRAYAQALKLATGRKIATPQILFCQPAGINTVNVPLEALQAPGTRVSEETRQATGSPVTTPHPRFARVVMTARCSRRRTHRFKGSFAEKARPNPLRSLRHTVHHASRTRARPVNVQRGRSVLLLPGHSE